MEPRPLPPPTSVAANSSSTKLRLMCSYGGQITPQLHTKCLFYAGGDSRIVGIPNANANALTLSSLITHVATTLNIQYPFTLKYQLPHEDLDSLISLSADEDLHIMLEEYDRLASSHAAFRIRLFLFPIKLPPVRPESTLPDLAQSVLQQKAVEGDWFRAELGRDELSQPVLQNPRTEAWFVDALRTARMMQKGGLEGQSEGRDGCGGGGVCGQESIVLETSSSFGSSSSSVSLSNLPPIKGHGDGNVANLQDSKAKLLSPELVASDNSVATDISYGQTGVYQQQVIPFHAMESKVSTNPFETDTKLLDPPSGVHMNKVVMVPGYPVSPLVDQPQQQVQIIHTGTHYIPQNPAGMLLVTSYYPMYHPLPPQQPHYQFQPTQPYPTPIPVGQSQPYSFPIRLGLVDTSNIVSAQPYAHPIVPFNTITQVASKEVTSAPHVPELTSQVYPTDQAANPLVRVPFNETLQQPLSLPQIHHQPQTISVAPRETFNYSNELDEDTARAQIYKSQPPGPALPSQYQTMTKATTVLLSEALAQFHTDNIQQQSKTSEPH